MGSIHEVIEAFRKAPSNSERGTKFEELMVRYFELDPVLSQQYESVWRWMDWPGRKGKPDTGIDLVARERDTGEYSAIQCKFYEPTHTLRKEDIDSFFTASGKQPFSNRIIISTTDRWGKHAEDALEDQTIPVQRIGMAEIAEAPIAWDIAWPDETPTVSLAPAVKHEPRKHQREAIDAVFRGFDAGHDRGKLIMACGTGKTFTALKIAERTAAENGGKATILFAVPSISLLSQTLREWSAQTQLDLRAFAVCSDKKVSRSAEDITTVDVAIPVTTDPAQLAAEMGHRKRAAGLTVVFTTYQSLPAVAEAQQQGVDSFDLVIADEAHRTTGVTLLDADESHFVRIHDADYLRATRRLYMTATPRIYDEKVKAKADEASAAVTSMDNEDDYGPEFHRLSFGHAVERGLLSDYKVLVLTVDQEMIADTVQQGMSAGFGELRLDDASKIVGCWNGLAKRAGTTPAGTGFTPGEAPMRRAVAFAKDIKASKQVADMFPAVVDGYRALLNNAEDDGRDIDNTNLDLSCEVHHVDGTFNALERGRELAWLKAPSAEDECRILTNARCLSEGVDVPALDAVLFLHPRNSVVDVVQSVGRVMRKAEGKDYGYIILPVAVPAGVEPSKALNDNQRFKTVWQVLNALRAHDDRFNAFVNSIALNNGAAEETGKGSDAMFGGHIGPVSPPKPEPGETESLDETGDPYATDPAQADRELAKQMALFSLSEWQEAIYARIVDKVGTRTYWEDWAKDVADIASALISRIRAILDDADDTVTDGFHKFVTGLRDNLNDSITDDDAISMLAQHLITKPVFDALFAGHAFADSNPVSITMQKMVDTLGGAGLEAETTKLEGFYASVRTRASEVTTAAGTQQVIAELYEKFFKVGFKKQADALGIVYTPTEIVDFILHAANHASREAFGRGLTDEDVHILDPFTGTGTFMTRLLQSGIITPADLARKYANELHANEIMLLAYYIAAVNIETTYHALTQADEYEPFEGIVLADTFQITEDGDSFDEVMFPQNNERITRQLAMPINVIVGNPPYSVGQNSANDLNANVTYPTLDQRITDTYAARSTAQNKNSLYDSYLRAFRWATDRIGEAGIVAFVSNGGWIDSNTADGIRLTLADEYSRIYVYNLRGNMRKSNWREEGGQIFGAGSQTTIAIWIGVKDPTHTGGLELLYRNIGDYLSRDEKLATIADGRLDNIDWATITPNEYGDWDDQRDAEFSTWPAIGDKRPHPGQTTVFRTHSSGLKTGRDAWCYSSSRAALEENIAEMLDQYEQVRREFAAHAHQSGLTGRGEQDVTAFLHAHPEYTGTGRVSWNSSLKQQLARDNNLVREGDAFRTSVYRPFQKQASYFSSALNERRYQLASMFPTPHHTNTGIILTGPASHFDFTPFITDLLPNLHVLDTAQFFPRWTYETVDAGDGGLDFGAGSDEADEWGYRRVDNITDAIQKLYTDTLDGTVAKDDIFYYVYGLLHDPSYRSTYAADLKKMLPHIPTPDSRERFDQLATAGRQLADLHTDYESVDPYPLDVELKASVSPYDRETWRVAKPVWGKKKDPGSGKNVVDHSTIVYNKKVTITGIPQGAERYMLGSRSALAWIIDRYQVKTDKASGIVNDPNDWCDDHEDPRYIVDLIAKVTTVAVETMKIVDRLSAAG